MSVLWNTGTIVCSYIHTNIQCTVPPWILTYVACVHDLYHTAQVNIVIQPNTDTLLSDECHMTVTWPSWLSHAHLRGGHASQSVLLGSLMSPLPHKPQVMHPVWLKGSKVNREHSVLTDWTKYTHAVAVLTKAYQQSHWHASSIIMYQASHKNIHTQQTTWLSLYTHADTHTHTYRDTYTHAHTYTNTLMHTQVTHTCNTVLLDRAGSLCCQAGFGSCPHHNGHKQPSLQRGKESR